MTSHFRTTSHSRFTTSHSRLAKDFTSCMETVAVRVDKEAECLGSRDKIHVEHIS